MVHWPEWRGDIEAKDFTLSGGGRGAAQALAALRSGAKVALVGKAGDDAYGEHIIGNLRREGVITSGIARSDTLPTGIMTYIYNEHGHAQIITAMGANIEARADQVPEEVLDAKAILLVQNELPRAEILAVLQKAKHGGAKTILNLAPSIHVTEEMLDVVDILIVNQPQARELAQKMVPGLDSDADAVRIAAAMSQLGGLDCIVTRGEHGSVAVTREGKSWSVEALPLQTEVDHSGAEDAYCGTLAASLQQGHALPVAMKRASIAASLTCTVKGLHKSLPYLDAIESHMEQLPEPQAL